MERVEVGTGRKIQSGNEIAILTIGHPGNFAVEASKLLKSEGINPAHYDMRFVKPLDEKMLHEIFSNYTKVITVEDGCLQGGFGSAVLEQASELDFEGKIKRLGIPDEVIEHGTQDQLYALCGYDVNGIVATVKSFSKTEKELV